MSATQRLAAGPEQQGAGGAAPAAGTEGSCSGARALLHAAGVPRHRQSTAPSPPTAASGRLSRGAAGAAFLASSLLPTFSVEHFPWQLGGWSPVSRHINSISPVAMPVAVEASFLHGAAGPGTATVARTRVQGRV